MAKYNPSATTSATNLAKTVANSSYSLLEYLHGMQGFKPPWLHRILLVIAIDSHDPHKSNNKTDIGL